ncbi:hypothetical protein BHE74_00008979, partial [Ensete ventricosum]
TVTAACVTSSEDSRLGSAVRGRLHSPVAVATRFPRPRHDRTAPVSSHLRRIEKTRKRPKRVFSPGR